MKLKNQIHPYHLVSYSPWPLGSSIASLIMTIGIVLSMNNYSKKILIVGIVLVLLTFILWVNDIITEGSLMGQNTSYVSRSITIGFVLFMISEIILFGSFFWAFIHLSINPSIELGNNWPPIGIESVDSKELPLTNTVILLTTGATITVSHNKYLSKEYKKTIVYIVITIVLLIVFMAFQYIEYKYSRFTITDSVFGSVFYMTTGLHFIHILIVTIYLIIVLIRIIYQRIVSVGIGSFEYCVIALHAYDIIWIFIYVSFYVWGGIE